MAHDQEKVDRLSEEIAQELIENFEPVLGDMLENFEDTMFNCVRVHEENNLDMRRNNGGASQRVNIAFNERSELDLYTIKEKMVEEFRDRVKELVGPVVQQKMERFNQNGDLT